MYYCSYAYVQRRMNKVMESETTAAARVGVIIVSAPQRFRFLRVSALCMRPIVLHPIDGKDVEVRGVRRALTSTQPIQLHDHVYRV